MIADTWNAPREFPRAAVSVRCRLPLDHRNQGMSIWSPAGTKYPMYGMSPVIRGVPYGALRNELEYFIHCVLDGKQPDVLTLEDAREALRIAVLADESYRTGRVVKA